MIFTYLREADQRPLLLFLVFLIPLFFFCQLPVKAETITRQKTIIRVEDLSTQMSVHLTAYVYGYLFDLEGLTSPWARVDFYSTEGNLEVTTLANNDGVFRFQNVTAPIQTGDFCFLSYDTNGIANNPLCFSPPPPKTKTIIRDIVLSPTLSFDKGIFRQGDLVEASGRTFPHAQIEVFMFEEDRPHWIDLIDVLIPKTFARTGPHLTINADANGDFSYNLPTQKSSLWRMFAGPRYKEENMVAKSNILEFSALSWWQWLIYKLLQFIYTGQGIISRIVFNWITIFILLIGLIGIIWKKLLNSNIKTRNQA